MVRSAESLAGARAAVEAIGRRARDRAAVDRARGELANLVTAAARSPGVGHACAPRPGGRTPAATIPSPTSTGAGASSTGAAAPSSSGRGRVGAVTGTSAGVDRQRTPARCRPAAAGGGGRRRGPGPRRGPAAARRPHRRPGAGRGRPLGRHREPGRGVLAGRACAIETFRPGRPDAARRLAWWPTAAAVQPGDVVAG